MSPRNDWNTRADLERETREGLAVAGPMSFAEAFYLARRAEGLRCMEALLATRTRGRQAGVDAVGDLLGLARAEGRAE